MTSPANNRNGAKWKAIVHKWSDISSYSADYRLYALTDQQTALLIAMCEYLSWSSRWIDEPPNKIDFRSQIEYDLMTPLDLCQLVADCINDPNSPTNAAIRDIAAGNNGYPPNVRLPDGYSNQNQAAGLNPTCDPDILFGQCRAIVVSTNRLIVDFLERFETATNVVEVGGVLSQLPVIDEIGIDAVVQYANFILSVLAENYDAQYTQALEDELACGLFCRFQDTCEVSIEGVAAYFAERVVLDFSSYNVFEDLITAMLGVPLDGSAVVSAMFALSWIGVRVSNIALDGIGDSALKIALKFGAGDPSDDWLLLCEDCSDVWDRTVDLTQYNGGFAVLDGFGTWVSGQGWVGTCVQFGNYYLANVLRLSASFVMTGITVEYVTASYQGLATTDRVWKNSDAGGNWLVTAAGGNGSPRTLVWDGAEQSVTAFGATVHAGNVFGTCPTGSVIVKRVTVRGKFDIPSALDSNGWV